MQKCDVAKGMEGVWKMEGKKALYRKYFPNSNISDANLVVLLNGLAKYYPGKPLKVVFKEMQYDNRFWERFQAKYPHADISKFHLNDTDGVRNIYFGDHWAWGETKHDRNAFSSEEVSALGRASSFPMELVLSNNRYPVPGVSFSDGTKDIADSLINLDIFVTPTNSFQVKMMNVFTKTVVPFWTSSQCYAWLGGPNYKYWPQQLNFAVWCATCGCGVSLVELAGFPKIIQGFLKFHVYFTVRRVLYELGVPLPNQHAFNQIDNTYNKSQFEALCNEFGVVNADFRWIRGRNHGLGDIFEYYSGEGYRNVHVDRGYDVEANTWPSKRHLFKDEGGDDGKGNLISLIRNDDSKAQYSWFVPSSGVGLTRRGMGRLNRSLEAFVYCVLGAQVNIRSGIVGNSGGAVEAQQEMLKLFESAVIEENLATSVQRYQLAVQEAKLRLDLAIAPGIWLMPSNLVINTESIVGYNNELQKASDSMQFGVNVGVNEKSKGVGIKHNLGVSKVKLPHVFHREGTLPPPVSSKPKDAVVDVGDTHETNKVAWMVGAAGLGWWMFR